MNSTPAAPGTQGKRMMIPGYVLKRADGVFVSVAKFPVSGGFEKFIDYLFSDGFRFVGLDYPLLMNLLYDYDAVLKAHSSDEAILLAQDIVPFPDNRKALYRGVKLDEDMEFAEYIFEQIQVEQEQEVEVYGEAGADGVRPVIGKETKTESVPCYLDVDEFIAEMWLKGIRFGIDYNKVAGAISGYVMARMVVASQQKATVGVDAEVIEASEALRQDNAPKILPNGKADLRKFQNRFPQIPKGARLLKKRTCVPGKPGHKINGERIEPEAVKDVDLRVLAGTGTRHEVQDGVEYIVSERGGFLALDVQTNLIEVTEQIENKGGVSAKTTGDLSLAGKDFIEHGEVQEGRTVEGVNMTFRSNVHGTIISKGGVVQFEKNLSNGSAKSFGGEITIKGRALNSIIEVHDRRLQKSAGNIDLNYAEGCLVVGQTVKIKQAINCGIVAEHVEIEQSEGCGIAARSVQLGTSNSVRNKENIIAMVLPDLSGFESKIRQEKKEIKHCELVIQAKDREFAQISANPEVAKYLSLAMGVRQGTVTLTAENQANWNKMQAKFSRIDTVLARLKAEKLEQNNRIEAIQQEIANLLEGREKSGQGIVCTVGKILGDTLLRTISGSNGLAELQKMNANDLKIKLRENGLPEDRVLFNDEGDIDWHFEVPEIGALEEE